MIFGSCVADKALAHWGDGNKLPSWQYIFSDVVNDRCNNNNNNNNRSK